MRPCYLAGIPEAGSIQEVLLWQTATIRMMYRIVGKVGDFPKIQHVSRSGSNALSYRASMHVLCLPKL